MSSLFSSSTILPGYLCANVGASGSASCSLSCPVPQSATSLVLPATTLWGLLVAAWLAPFHNPPLHWVRQPLPCCESSLPQLPISAPPTGLDNVSSLSPWLLDFHTVQFSVSSGCFLFLSCCCPSFGCARRHSVSTYASILAGR